MQTGMNRTLMVLIGPGGSGKTTFAKDYIQKNPGWIRVSRDDLRRQVLGERDFGTYFKQNNLQMEKHITHLQMEQIRYWLTHGFNVIIDNPHLKADYLHTYQEFFGHLADILFVPLRSADLETCKNRIRKREGEHVDVQYLERHFANFHKVLQDAGDVLDRTIPRKNEKRSWAGNLKKNTYKDCIIVDIDGTIADSRGRSFNEGNKLYLDKPIYPVHYLLNKVKSGLYQNPVIVYLTGREDIWREQTIQWLKKNGFPWDGEIYMRKTGDCRSDVAVKTDILIEHIAGKYRPLLAIEDHLQVCHGVWYKLGIFCFNVNQGLKTY